MQQKTATGRRMRAASREKKATICQDCSFPNSTPGRIGCALNGQGIKELTEFLHDPQQLNVPLIPDESEPGRKEGNLIRKK
jgi:hypothetical protein